MKHCTVGDILTDAEIERAKELYRQYKNTGQFASKVCVELIEPNMARINKQLGQENDAKYLAYAVEYALSCTQS
jgi:hypothetical protein